MYEKKEINLSGKIYTLHVVFDGIFKVEGRPKSCLAFRKFSVQLNGPSKTIVSSVEIPDAAALAILHRDYKSADEIILTLKTDLHMLSSKLVSFEKATPSTDELADRTDALSLKRLKK